MSIVNFAIPKTLEGRVDEVMETKGFASKAEFFRFAAMFFMESVSPKYKDEDERLASLTKELKQRITKAYGGKKLPSAREQYDAWVAREARTK